jgi:transposase
MNIYIEPAASATETAADSGAPQAKSWRDFLPIHPAAELFPRMSEAQLATVAKDIKVNGLKIPIVLWVPGSKDDYPNDSDPPRFALDGINRLDAMERAGLQLIDEHEPTDPFTSLFYAHAITKYESDTDPYAYVISADIHRRHLTAEQKRELIAKLIEADPSKSDRQIAETVKASPTTVGTVRAKMEAKGDVSNLDTRRDTKGRQQPAHRTTSAPSEAKSHKIKFTLERIAQIKNLIERGMSRGEIAEIIGVTVGSLQVTCSRLGLSLRRPRLAMTTTPPSSRDSGATETRKSDDIGPKSASERDRQ